MKMRAARYTATGIMNWVDWRMPHISIFLVIFLHGTAILIHMTEITGEIIMCI